MQTFRKAFVRARSSQDFNPGWEYKNTDPPCPSDTWRNVSYTVIEDKPVHSASGILPITERTPVAGSAGAVWSKDLFASMDYGEEKDLSRVEYEINSRRYSFTTAAYKEMNPLPSGMKKVAVEDYQQKGSSSWKWTDIWQEDTTSLPDDRGWRKGERLYYEGDYLDDKGKRQFGKEQLRMGDTADFDGDGEEEAIITFLVYCHKLKKNTTDDHDKDASARKKCDKAHDIYGVRLLDYQEGEVNLTEKTDTGKVKGGLQQDYTKETLVDSSTFSRQETASGITTMDNINAQEIFNRVIKTTDGDDYDVVDELPTQKTETWYTPHK